MSKTHASYALLFSLLLLCACGKSPSGDSTIAKTEDVEDTISNTISEASEKVRKEIEEGNMSLGNVDGKASAEITPKGDLLIDKKPITINDEQRQLLIKHRQILSDVAVAGMEVGMQGVNLAKKAVGESIKGIFSGDSENIEKKIEREAKEIEMSADTLCNLLPSLLESQRKLSDALPEFKPYATMTMDDIEDCHGKVTKRE